MEAVQNGQASIFSFICQVVGGLINKTIDLNGKNLNDLHGQGLIFGILGSNVHSSNEPPIGSDVRYIINYPFSYDFYLQLAISESGRFAIRAYDDSWGTWKEIN